MREKVFNDKNNSKEVLLCSKSQNKSSAILSSQIYKDAIRELVLMENNAELLKRIYEFTYYMVMKKPT